MNPIKAQRTWHSLSTKWINAISFGRGIPLRNTRRRRVKKGYLVTNLIPVEVVNAITGEISKGYMRDISLKKLRKWLGYHNHRAQVEQIFLSPKITFSHLTEGELKGFPVLIKLGKYQLPYLIARSWHSLIVRKRQTFSFDLNTVDNLKYLETIADRKGKIMKLFNKIKKARKVKRNG